MKAIIDYFSTLISPDKDTGCWMWIGSKKKQGYGQITFGKKNFLAHRLAYEFWNDEIPKGMLVCHKCDVRACVNPSHLFLGTYQDNVDDMHRKGRHWARRGFDHGMGKLTEENVLAIREDSRVQRVIAEDFGISAGHVNRIKKRKEWAWLS